MARLMAVFTGNVQRYREGVALYTLGEILPMRNPPVERMLIRQVVHEVVWDVAASRPALAQPSSAEIEVSCAARGRYECL